MGGAVVFELRADETAIVAQLIHFAAEKPAAGEDPFFH